MIRDHGLTDAHCRPLVGVRRAADATIRSWLTTPARAWCWPLVEWARTPNSIPALAFDLDAAEAREEVSGILAIDLPEPNLVIWRMASGHATAVYTLRRRVFTGENARPTPIAALGRVSEWLHQRLHADPGFVGVLVANPVHPDYRVDWRRTAAYSLRELLDVIPNGWQAPRHPNTAVGRNVGLFRTLCRFAGTAEHTVDDIRNHARKLYRALPDVFKPHAFTESELEGIVRSVLRYRARWKAAGWHQPRWIARQAIRGRKAKNQAAAGIASGKARRRVTADRDRRILAHLRAGQSTRQVADAENIDQSTVVRAIQRRCAEAVRKGTPK